LYFITSLRSSWYYGDEPSSFTQSISGVLPMKSTWSINE